jgi:hypothetical protein
MLCEKVLAAIIQFGPAAIKNAVGSIPLNGRCEVAAMRKGADDVNAAAR